MRTVYDIILAIVAASVAISMLGFSIWLVLAWLSGGLFVFAFSDVLDDWEDK